MAFKIHPYLSMLKKLFSRNPLAPLDEPDLTKGYKTADLMADLLISSTNLMPLSMKEVRLVARYMQEQFIAQNTVFIREGDKRDTGFMLLLLEGAYLLWQSYKSPQAQKIQARLRALSASRDNSQQTQLLKQRMLSEVPAIERALLQMAQAQTLDRFILQAGLDWTVSRLLLSCAAFAAVACLLMLYGLHQAFWMAGLAGAAAGAVPLLYVSHRRSGRLSKFERQLPEALDLITRALRAGHAFSSALQMVGEEMAEPIAGEFRTVHDEVNFGVARSRR